MSLTHNHSKAQVLIVEDEVVLAMGMEMALEQMGFDVTGIETTAERAITHAQEKKPDLVLMDINLKGASTGIEAAKTIWERQNTPIIFLTSYSDDATIQEAMQSQPYGYLIKPCKDALLKSTILTTLHKHESLKKPKEELIELAFNLRFSPQKKLLFKEDTALKLTGNEIKLFEVLCKQAGLTVSFEQISLYIWQESIYDMGKLRTLVYRLRKKLGVDLFENVYEAGYRLKVA